MRHLRSLKLAAAAAVPLAFSLPAAAELPPGVETAFTTLQADILALQAMGWVLLAAVFVGFVLMKVFKKVGNRAT